MSPQILLAAGCCLSVLPLAGGGLVLHRAKSREKIVAIRIGAVRTTYASVTEIGERRSYVGTDIRVSATIRAERVFGFDRRMRPHRGIPFGRVIGICAAVGVVSAVLASGPAGRIGYLLAPIVCVTLSRYYYRRCEERHKSKLFQQFPDALGMIVRAVRVGVSLGSSVIVVADESQQPTAGEFRQLSEEIAIGLSLPDALRAMAARNRLPEYRFFATALSLQSQTGGGLAETLETLADTIRKRVAVKHRGHALAAEARTSCYVLGVLPFAVGGFLFATDRPYVSILFTTSGGEKLLGVATALLTVGLLTMRLITKRMLG